MYSLRCICVCYIHMLYTHIVVYAHVCAHAPVLFHHSLPYFHKTVCLTESEARLRSASPIILLSLAPVWRTVGMCVNIRNFVHGFWRLKSLSHFVCLINTLAYGVIFLTPFTCIYSLHVPKRDSFVVSGLIKFDNCVCF